MTIINVQTFSVGNLHSIYCLPNTGLVQHLDAHVLSCQGTVVFLLTETIFLNVKNTYGGVLLLVKLQALASKKVTLLHRCFSRVLDFTNGAKSRKASHLVYVPNNNIK